MRISVIICTYNKPAWLEKVLIGFAHQTYTDYEIVIADDGSGPETKSLVERFRENSGIMVHHVWQPDEGFQKSMILNKAILASTSDYLIFTDDDCIPRKDFIEVHAKNAEAGRFLSGGYFMLPMGTSKKISAEDIASGKAFNPTWLRQNGLDPTFRILKLIARGLIQDFLNTVTTTKPTWNGHNASGWKKDLMKVNGFNEKMQYGGQDRELGERLENLGIRGKQIRYSAICIHLDHARPYKTKESIQFNRSVREATRRERKIRTEFGITKD